MRFLVASLLLLVACRPEVVEQMAHATKQIDATYSSAYDQAAEYCLEFATSLQEYRTCMRTWDEGADAVGILHDTTLALDLAQDRKSFRAAGCAWYRAVAVVDALSPVDIPAANTALATRWRRKC